ncbi:hypothetical protein [Methyloceanibacter sp.]|uniref:hypothetical protein n=1 Tax=Methyloceanibacter sp. TaxID=1965321 RepID=UPI002C962A3C|nr:hypothetical protein [Methyloceanibacter sp.]HML91248.1 hypothetical protein [Methyloceanibacter sp.]
MDFAFAVLRKVRALQQEALHLGLGLVSARCEAFEGLADRGRQRLVGHHHLAGMSGQFLVAISDRRAEAPIAIGCAGPHAIARLLGILLTLMLRDGCEKVLDQHAVRVFPEFDGRTLQLAADR